MPFTGLFAGLPRGPNEDPRLRRFMDKLGRALQQLHASEIFTQDEDGRLDIDGTQFDIIKTSVYPKIDISHPAYGATPRASATLVGAITDSQTTLVLDDVTDFTFDYDFYIAINTEIMRVTATDVATKTLTVERPIQSTAESHLDGAEVRTDSYEPWRLANLVAVFYGAATLTGPAWDYNFLLPIVIGTDSEQTSISIDFPGSFETNFFYNGGGIIFQPFIQAKRIQGAVWKGLTIRGTDSFDGLWCTPGTMVLAAGTTQGTATQLANEINVLCRGTSVSGVLLYGTGSVQIANTSLNTQKIYPQSGKEIATETAPGVWTGLGANNPYSLTDESVASFVWHSGTSMWRCTLGVASVLFGTQYKNILMIDFCAAVWRNGVRWGNFAMGIAASECCIISFRGGGCGDATSENNAAMRFEDLNTLNMQCINLGVADNTTGLCCYHTGGHINVYGGAWGQNDLDAKYWPGCYEVNGVRSESSVIGIKIAGNTAANTDLNINGFEWNSGGIWLRLTHTFTCQIKGGRHDGTGIEVGVVVADGDKGGTITQIGVKRTTTTPYTQWVGQGTLDRVVYHDEGCWLQDGSGNLTTRLPDRHGLSASSASFADVNKFDPGLTNRNYFNEVRVVDNTTNYVGIGGAGSITSYTITLPAAAPASNNMVMSFTTGGVAAFVTVASLVSITLVGDVTGSGSSPITTTVASIPIGAAIGSGTATRILFEGAGPVLADSARLTWSGSIVGIVGADGSSGAVYVDTYGQASGSEVRYRAAGGTLASPSTVANGQVLGRFQFYGHDGTNFERSAIIQVEVFGSVAADTVPTDIVFYNTTTNSVTEKLRIKSDGKVGIGTDTPASRLDATATSGGQAQFSYDANNYMRVTVGSTGAATVAFTGNSAQGGNATITTPAAASGDNQGGDLLLNPGAGHGIGRQGIVVVNSNSLFQADLLGATVWRNLPGSDPMFRMDGFGHLASFDAFDGTPGVSIAAGAGAGTGPTLTITGSDLAGVIEVATGTLPSISSVVGTITFGAAWNYGTSPKAVIMTPANSAAALLTGVTNIYVDPASISDTDWAFISGTTALAGSTTYKWFYWVMG